jgi:hypothetical protein
VSEKVTSQNKVYNHHIVFLESFVFTITYQSYIIDISIYIYKHIYIYIYVYDIKLNLFQLGTAFTGNFNLTMNNILVTPTIGMVLLMGDLAYSDCNAPAWDLWDDQNMKVSRYLSPIVYVMLFRTNTCFFY